MKGVMKMCTCQTRTNNLLNHIIGINVIMILSYDLKQRMKSN